MKTLAALGLLLFSGVLVVSGAMMGTVGALPDAAPAAAGPCEIRVYVLGPDGQDLPRERVQEPSLLVEPLGRGAADTPAAPGGGLCRTLDLEWVEPREGAAPRAKTPPRGQVRRDDEGYAARVLVLERKDGEDARRGSEGEGGYWRAFYAPTAERPVAGFGTTLVFKDRGRTRTLAGFSHP